MVTDSCRSEWSSEGHTHHTCLITKRQQVCECCRCPSLDTTCCIQLLQLWTEHHAGHDIHGNTSILTPKRHFLSFLKARAVGGGHPHFLLRHTSVRIVSGPTCCQDVNRLHTKFNSDLKLRGFTTEWRCSVQSNIRGLV